MNHLVNHSEQNVLEGLIFFDWQLYLQPEERDEEQKKVSVALFFLSLLFWLSLTRERGCGGVIIMRGDVRSSRFHLYESVQAALDAESLLVEGQGSPWLDPSWCGLLSDFL